MADQLQLRGGTTSENLLFAGAQREVTVDTDKHALVVHDGITNGGFPTASEARLNSFTIFFDDDTGGGSVADAYQLSATDNTILPAQYNDGQYYGFVTSNPNTGPATVNFIGLGQKNVKYADGSDPEAGDIDGRVTMIYDEDNDWFELQRKYQGQQIQSRVSSRQTVLTGPVDSDGNADFVTAGAGLQAIASGLSSVSLLLSFGDGFTPEQGAVDILVEVSSNQVFGGLTDNDVNYLYLDYDAVTESLTPGSTILSPAYSRAKPTSPSSGQFWYPVDHRSSGEYWNGSAWVPVLRVFIGEAETSGGSVSSVVSYPYQTGSYVDTPIGVNQRWQDLTASRSQNTEYTNDTGRPIKVRVATGTSDSGMTIEWTINGEAFPATQANYDFNGTVVDEVFIPDGATYEANVTAGGLDEWWELR
jgi:hypothetical protein